MRHSANEPQIQALRTWSLVCIHWSPNLGRAAVRDQSSSTKRFRRQMPLKLYEVVAPGHPHHA